MMPDDMKPRTRRLAPRTLRLMRTLPREPQARVAAVVSARPNAIRHPERRDAR